MNSLFLLISVFFILVFTPSFAEAHEGIHHDLKVILNPEEHRIDAKDTIILPNDLPREIEFLLHAGLKPTSLSPGVRIIKGVEKPGTVPLESFKAILPPGLISLVIAYSGAIYHPIESTRNEQARGFKDTPGLISSEGAFLSGNTFWYPQFNEGMLTFTLEVKLPPGWDAVSQGERTLHDSGKHGTKVQWKSPELQDQIYLVAAKFTEYTKPAKNVTAMVFLRAPDETLANKYLDATASYLEMYDKLIGPYPYKKFALVENFWETGFGMPSFTLLGSQVIRLPFIINSSYPHEILHNWWGNSVFPDYAKGNWSEGLTAYLADHLMKELQGEGPEYRLATLQKYADYVIGGRDFPLTQFRSRHSSSSEAIGYGKSLMFFHMLRLELGDEAFKRSLQDFYNKYKFQFASFDDIRKSFEAVSGKDLKHEFDLWVTRTGAPELRLNDAETRRRRDGKTGDEGRGTKDETKGGNEYALTAHIRQAQHGEAYRLRIPVAVTMEGQERAYQTVLNMDAKTLEFKLVLPSRPLRLDMDPEFDLFRRLDREEIPPALSQALGAKKMLVLLPSSADRKLLGAYRELANSIGRSGPDTIDIKLDSDVKTLPSDRAVTLIGWENRFVKEIIPALSEYDVALDKSAVRLGRTEIKKGDHSFMFSCRNPKDKEQALTLIASDLPEALPGLGRKLPHYHKYSYLAFEGSEPLNIAKGRWPVLNSPMTIFFPAGDGVTKKVEMAKLSPREPLASVTPVLSKERMMETVRFLSNEKLKGRGLGTPGLDEAANYIAEKFKEAGLKPGGEAASWFQTWEETFTQNPPPSLFSKGGDERIPSLTKGGKGGFETQTVMTLKNVVGVIPGNQSAFTGQSVVIGAHYDHLGLGWPDVRDKNKGKIHPGADDNASGVAVLLELARVLANGPKPDRTIVFAAFTGEEAGKLGSKHYATYEKDNPAGQCIGMINLDTVGRLDRKKLLILGAGSAREWVHIFRGAGFVTGVETETVSEELDSSDQKSFQEAGVPAVQLFTGPHPDYHRPTDTADKIDAEGLVKVAAVAKEAVEYLASTGGHLTATVKPGGLTETTSKKERRVTLGTIPDFSYKGEGVRIEGVIPGSPAEAIGLKQGDVLIRINDSPLHSLKDLSDILKSLNPGDRIFITVLRNEKKMTVNAVLHEK
jgi:aminopeptidase N